MKEKVEKTKCCATERNKPKMLNLRKIFFSAALILSITLPILETVSAESILVRLETFTSHKVLFRSDNTEPINIEQGAVQLPGRKYLELERFLSLIPTEFYFIWLLHFFIDNPVMTVGKSLQQIQAERPGAVGFLADYSTFGVSLSQPYV